jgi:type IV pilus assembly protein PilB
MEANVTHKFLDSLGDNLVNLGFITESQLEEAVEEMEGSEKHLGEILTELNFITDEKLNEFIEENLKIPVLDLDEYEADPNLVGLVDENVARKYGIVPLFEIENVLTVAMSDPLNVFAIEKIKGITNRVVEPVMASSKSINRAINKLWSMENSISRVVDGIDSSIPDDEVDIADFEKAASEAPIIKLTNSIIEKAVEENASDIHVEPEKDSVRIRYRIDGVLTEIDTLEKKYLSAVVTRIKVMGGMDIGQRRLPQDGKARFDYQDREIDLRISTYPVIYGEKVVLRILDTHNVITSLESLGLNEYTLERYRRISSGSNGIILVTGPTGSGKTTTLYSTLNEIISEKLNITTIEDPIEYEMPGINQGQVNRKAGVTFASALRSIVRQDPDIILVGEIRDLETAELAIRAALTGHLVFSTLHTNTAAGAISRLLDMGIEPFLLASSVRGVLGQRLVRKICQNCATDYAPPEHQREALDLDTGEQVEFRRGEGCSKCRKLGYSGRTGIYEIMAVDNTIREMILDRASDDMIQEAAVEEGMITMRRDGVRKIADGITTCSEVLRVS